MYFIRFCFDWQSHMSVYQLLQRTSEVEVSKPHLFHSFVRHTYLPHPNKVFLRSRMHFVVFKPGKSLFDSPYSQTATLMARSRRPLTVKTKTNRKHSNKHERTTSYPNDKWQLKNCLFLSFFVFC